MDGKYRGGYERIWTCIEDIKKWIDMDSRLERGK